MTMVALVLCLAEEYLLSGFTNVRDKVIKNKGGILLTVTACFNLALLLMNCTEDKTNDFLLSVSRVLQKSTFKPHCMLKVLFLN